MKNSGIEWIGNIPDSWGLVRFKDLCTNKKEVAGKNSGNFDRLALTLNGVIKRPKDDSEGLQPKEFDTYQVLYENDFVFKMIDLQNISTSRVGLSHYTGLVSPAYIRFSPKKEGQYNEFVYYFLMSMYYNCVFNSLGGNGVRSALNATDMGQLIIPYPSLETQKRIVEFIETKLAQVDKMIANQQGQIEKLKVYKQSVITEAVTKGLDKSAPLKDSGIEWIGEIPAHWDIIATKSLFDVIAGATPDSSNPLNWDGEIRWITPADYKTEDIYVEFGRRNLSKIGFNSCSTSLIPAGNIIFSKRAPIGAVVINNTELCTNQGCLSCVNKGLANIKFYYYIMSIATEQYELLGSGTTFKEISCNTFSNFRLPYPSLETQQQIADYLDEKCEKIDQLIAIKQEKIEKLQEYKKSLIYEYVTGKKEVV